MQPPAQPHKTSWYKPALAPWEPKRCAGARSARAPVANIGAIRAQHVERHHRALPDRAGEALQGGGRLLWRAISAATYWSLFWRGAADALVRAVQHAHGPAAARVAHARQLPCQPPARPAPPYYQRTACRDTREDMVTAWKQRHMEAACNLSCVSGRFWYPTQACGSHDLRVQGYDVANLVSVAVWRSMAGKAPRRSSCAKPWRRAAHARYGGVPSSRPAAPGRLLFWHHWDGHAFVACTPCSACSFEVLHMGAVVSCCMHTQQRLLLLALVSLLKHPAHESAGYGD